MKSFAVTEKLRILQPIFENDTIGEMLEWLKRHAWKACIRLKRIGGSNPPLSAKNKQVKQNKNSNN